MLEPVRKIVGGGGQQSGSYGDPSKSGKYLQFLLSDRISDKDAPPRLAQLSVMGVEVRSLGNMAKGSAMSELCSFIEALCLRWAYGDFCSVWHCSVCGLRHMYSTSRGHGNTVSVTSLTTAGMFDRFWSLIWRFVHSRVSNPYPVDREMRTYVCIA
jgi:hypothetical protein